MYPSVAALPSAAVKAAMGVDGASPPPRAPRPRPPRPAAPRPAAAADDGLAPAPAGKPAAAAGAAAGLGFNAATTGLRSSSVDHRRIWIFTGRPISLTFADV